jgi:16S rRNA (guanine(966)-N(2))-methyltransferase RsmD
MRIISGSHKGRRLTAPKNLPVRPTTDFAKEGLFNILHHQIDFPEVTMLDLFSGTGNIAFEFASRGCPEITSVDAHHGCVAFIKKTADELEFPISTIKSDVFKYLEKATGSYDVIFADPPYAFEVQELNTIVEKIFQNGLLKPDGMIIIEHSKQIDISELPHFEHFRRYGGSVFSFFA